MKYKNSEIKIDQLVTYLSASKINLSPAFQRGHVWNVRFRRKLIQNMLEEKPIPAIFLYKEASGTTYLYNILDGKQRLESIILFIGSQRDDLKINNWKKYFFRPVDHSAGQFWVSINGGKKTFKDLDDTLVRNFSEYVIPVIEITLDENVSLDEIISLFVDINQQGVAVKRFDIVKAMCKNDSILKASFRQIALEQKRGDDVYYKMINNNFTQVLKKLSIIEKVPESNSKVDKMWEKFLEIVVFCISKQHQKPVEILKGFIGGKLKGEYKLTKQTLDILRRIFSLLKLTYSDNKIANSKLAKDYTHFYTMTTTLAATDLLTNFNNSELGEKLISMSTIVDTGKDQTKKVTKEIREYLELASKHTTDTARRAKRNELFYKMICSL